MKDKAARQAALLRLVRRQALSNQEQMVRLLRERGFQATQSSVSRDVRELGLVRLKGRYVPASGAIAERNRSTEPSWTELVTATQPVGANLVILRTAPAAAAAVAAEVDQARLPEVVGTLAGDDTVFVAVPSRAAQGRVLAWLRRRPAAANPLSHSNPN